ncbi:NUDIX hydrolase domain-like protein [Russula vinacea]|nr:NUDIX hydrolase domain-like protein [Russula vinacea]
MSTQESLISVLNVCDNFRPHLSHEPLVPFLLAREYRPPIGLLRPPIVAALRADNAWRSAHDHPLAWDIPSPQTQMAPPTPPRSAGDQDGDGNGAFADVIGGSRWRAEWYDWRGYVFSMERAACALFGVVTYGVHMTFPVRVWVPRRAATKPTYPGMLDNSVAGGIPGGTSAFDSLVKEAAEEASLDPQLVRKRARAVGAVSYYRRTTSGWLQPEVQHVYDMRLEPGEVRLAPMDGEVESFKLMSIDEVVSCPYCKVLIDFLVRHGYLTPENEPRYLEINQRLHGQFDIERW